MNVKNVIALTKQPYDKITLWKTNKEQTNTMIQGYTYYYGTLKAPTCDGPYDTGPVPKFHTTQTEVSTFRTTQSRFRRCLT